MLTVIFSVLFYFVGGIGSIYLLNSQPAVCMTPNQKILCMFVWPLVWIVALCIAISESFQ